MEDDVLSFPTLVEKQVAVLQIDVMTGIVLLENGARYLGKGNCYIVFNDSSSAEKFAYEKLTIDKTIEFHLYNYKKEELLVIKDNGYIKSLTKKK